MGSSTPWNCSTPWGISALTATIFLGGWWLWGLDHWVPSWLILLAKTGLVYFLFIWLRGTLPRLRIDQLMAFGWKFLVPAGLVFLTIAAVERTLLIEEDWDRSVALPIMAIVNAAFTVAAVLGYVWLNGRRARRLPSHPILVRGRVGGLRAARDLQEATARALPGESPVAR